MSSAEAAQFGAARSQPDAARAQAREESEPERFTAPGKLLLAGEYAILEPGRSGLVCAVEPQLALSLATEPATHAGSSPSRISLWHRPSGASLSGTLSGLSGSAVAPVVWEGGTPDELRFAARAVALALRLCAEEGLAPRGFAATFENELALQPADESSAPGPAGEIGAGTPARASDAHHHQSARAIKLGLGGSAAACVLAVRAACSAQGRPLSARESLALASAAHWLEQGGAGSGADVAACALGGLLSVRTERIWPSVEYVSSLSASSLLASPTLTATPTALPAGLRLLVAWSGSPADTRALLRSVRAFAAARPHRFRARLDEISRCTKAITDALTDDCSGAAPAGAPPRSGDFEELLDAVRRAAAAMAALGEESGTPIVTARLAEICAVAASAGCAGKPSGAGGGDCAVIFAPDDAASARAMSALAARQIFPVGRSFRLCLSSDFSRCLSVRLRAAARSPVAALSASPRFPTSTSLKGTPVFTRPNPALLLLASLVALSAPARAGGFLSDEALKSLPADTKGSCLVQAQLSPKNFGALDGPVTMVTTRGEIEAEAADLGTLSMTLGGFAFVNVPKGPFRISHMHYKALLKAATPLKKAEWQETDFNLLGLASAAARRGDVPVEMSGTCNGGFIFLGLFKGEGGTVLSAPSFALGNDSIEAGNAMHALQKQLKGTAWEAEIDHPADNKPLPKDKVIERVLTAEEQAKQDEASKKAVAAIAGQTHNAKAPPSDDGAVAAAVGTYPLATVNGKPPPYVYEANKCSLNDGVYELKADASYVANGTIECAGKTFPFPTSGYFGIVGGVLTWAVAVGPPVAPGTVTKFSGDAITTIAGPETYVYKKK